MARSGYDAVVGADCVWGIIVPGKRDHNREEAYVGTPRVVDDGRGDVDLMTGTGKLRREGREMQEGPGNSMLICRAWRWAACIADACPVGGD